MYVSRSVRGANCCTEAVLSYAVSSMKEVRPGA